MRLIGTVGKNRLRATWLLKQESAVVELGSTLGVLGFDTLECGRPVDSRSHQ